MPQSTMEQIFAVKTYRERWLACSNKARFIVLMLMTDHFELKMPRELLDLAENLHEHLELFENFDDWLKSDEAQALRTEFRM